MRKVLMSAMQGVRRLQNGWLKLRGLTPADEASRRVVSGEAWDEFCDTLKSAGVALRFPGAPLDPASQAEGYRYLARLARAGLEAFVEDADPTAPRLKRVVHETAKMGADNPDNHYAFAAISGRHRYRISGTRGTVAWLSFGTQVGHYGQGGGMPPTGFLDAADLQVAPDGTLTIDLACERPADAENWLPMTPETGTLIVRQTFLDRSAEVPADLRIERTDGPHQPGPLTPEALDDGLRSASTLVAGASLLFAKWARDFQGHVNRLPRFDPATSNAAGGDPNIAYYHSYWQLGPDEALVIEVRPPDCAFWNFQLNNHWMESLDYRYFRIHLNQATAVLEPDGRVLAVVAHEDPGHPNWIQTVGHRQGTMCWRWVRAAENPEPQARVVNLAAWRAARAAGGAP